MANLIIKDPPAFTEEICAVTEADKITAELENRIKAALLNNDVFLKKILEKLNETATEHIEDGGIHVTEQDKADWDRKAETTAATQSAAGLMSAGDKQKLDNVAANAEVNQDAFSNVKVGNVTITANGKTATFTLEAGSNITLSADNAAKKIIITANRDGGNADTLDGYHSEHFAAADHRHIQVDNWRQGTDLPSTYPKGESIFFSNNPANKFNGLSYCTVHTIKGYVDNVPACIQFIYPYNDHADRYFFREALYNNDTWRGWQEVITSANIGSQTVASATKAIQDGNGNNIVNTYAKKSIYKDDGIALNLSGTLGYHAIALGVQAVKASGYGAFATGYQTEATGSNCFVAGYESKAKEANCIAFGTYNIADTSNSIAIGHLANAKGAYSFALGDAVIAKGIYSFVIGRNNVEDSNGKDFSYDSSNIVFMVGSGNANENRKNALSLTFGGILKTAGTITASTAADYAEFFEWLDGNLDVEDRVGHFVALDGDKVRIADSTDTYILGIVSGRPFVLGNGDCNTWTEMYLHDEFNREIMEPAPKIKMVELTKEVEREIEEIDEETGEIKTTIVKETIVTGHEEREVFDEDGNPVYEGTRPKLNPEYDHTQTYISRFDRPEWAAIGMLGVLAVYDDGSCQVNGYCKVADGGIATAAQGEYMLAEGKILRGYRVIERVADNIVKVIFR